MTKKNIEHSEIVNLIIEARSARDKIYREKVLSHMAHEFTIDGIEKRAKADARKKFREEFAEEIAAGEAYAAKVAAEFAAKYRQ